MENKFRWQVPGNANPFSVKLENWQNDEVSKRSIGVLEFIQNNNPTKTCFEENIKSYRNVID